MWGCAGAHIHKGHETAGKFKHNTQKKEKLFPTYSKTILKQQKFLRESLSQPEFGRIKSMQHS